MCAILDAMKALDAHPSCGAVRRDGPRRTLAIVSVREALQPSPVTLSAAPDVIGAHEAAGHPPPASTSPLAIPDPQLFDAVTASAELPPGGEFTTQGERKRAVVPDSGPAVGGAERRYYTVEVEEGVRPVGGPEGLASDVSTILADARGWIGGGKHDFQRVDSGEPDLRIRLTSQLQRLPRRVGHRRRPSGRQGVQAERVAVPDRRSLTVEAQWW
jgi:hypothetical protein